MANDYPTLKTGSRGDLVVFLKTLLASWGYHAESDYPHYVKATAEAVHLFQMRHLGSGERFLIETPGVVPGVVGEETWRALDGTTGQRMGLDVDPRAGLRRQIPRKDSTRGIGDAGDPAAVRQAFLEFCKGLHDAGTGERPKGSNWGDGVTPMLKHCGLGANPWCAAGMVYALHKSVGVELPSKKCARVCLIWNACRAAGSAFTLTDVAEGRAVICPGDLFVQLHKPLRANGTAPNVNGHIGAIAGIGSGVGGGRCDTFEGNSDDRWRAGNRALSTIVGIIQWAPPSRYDFQKGKGWRFQDSDGGRDR